MYLRSIILVWVAMAESSELLRCIPCSRAYTSNKFHIRDLLNGWCLNFSEGSATEFAVRFRNVECIGESRVPTPAYHFCIPCTSMRNENDFLQACSTLSNLDINRNDKILDLISNLHFPDKVIPCEREHESSQYTNGFVMFNGQCEELLMQGSCLPGQWLIYDNKLKCEQKKCQEDNHFLFGDSCVNLSSMYQYRQDAELRLQLNGTLNYECMHGVNPTTGQCISTSSSTNCGPQSRKMSLDDDTNICVPHLCQNDYDLYREDADSSTVMTSDGPLSVYQMRCWTRDEDSGNYCNDVKGCSKLSSCRRRLAALETTPVLKCKPQFVKIRKICVRASFYKFSRAHDSTGKNVEHQGCSPGLVYDRILQRCIETVILGGRAGGKKLMATESVAPSAARNATESVAPSAARNACLCVMGSSPLWLVWAFMHLTVSRGNY